MTLHRSISPMQSKVARTYLEWSQGDLAAAAKVSLSTVSSFENGFSPRVGSIQHIRKALENAGIEFGDNDGVKRQDNEVKLYRGFGSAETFYNDILQTVKNHGGDIVCIVKSQDILLRLLGITDFDDLAPLEILGGVSSIKCLISGTPTDAFAAPSVHFRMTADYSAAPSCYVGFGNKYAHIVQENRTGFIFSVFRIPLVAQSYRVYFESLWSNAVPLREQAQIQNRRTAQSARC